MAAADVVGAVSEGEQHTPCLQHMRREPQHVERRGVGPVQVLDHDDQGACRR